MRILLISENFYPEKNAPGKRLFEHAKEWIKLGHQVTVITGAPNAPKGKVFDQKKCLIKKLFDQKSFDQKNCF